ncbi:MAG: hypothetical protein WCF98_06815 [Synechococcus sp. ELA057]
MDFVKPPRGERLRLGLRNLYIVPTRFGWLWLAAVVMLQIVGIQMRSNGPLLLSDLMLGLLLLALHLTHFNLQGVELSAGDPQPGFAGATLTYPLQLRCPSRCEGLRLHFAAAEPLPLPVLERGEHRLMVPWIPPLRGLQPPGILRIQTTAPLGLFVCWSRWQPPVPQLVYPERREGPVRLLIEAADQPLARLADPVQAAPGSDHWWDLQPHRPEDGVSRLAWKLVAQGRGRHSKVFRAPAERLPLLAPDPAVPFEQALEHLSARICRLHAQGSAYGLVLPRESIPAGAGHAQRARALAALATA